ncbi:MAG: cation transporter dimerization domain-containing protein, partial [Candidatus Thermoplasmatota archaeon]|nr:cation transporter dimerization domain-containing protein [Candidatus Thermoplasmatota archaeon]
ILEVDRVVGAPQVRVRGAGPDLFVDATVEVPRALGMEKAHAVMDEVEAAVRETVGEADIVVHAEPVAVEESVATRLKVLAAREPGILGIHEIFVDDLDGGLVVDCHVEVDEDLTLEQAHSIAQAFETRVKARLDRVVGMRTHIEPMPVHPREGRDVTGEHDELVERIEESVPHDPFTGAGGIAIKEVGGRLEAIVTALAPGDLPLERAHEAADSLERVLHAKLPALDRVVVHVEPAGEA